MKVRVHGCPTKVGIVAWRQWAAGAWGFWSEYEGVFTFTHENGKKTRIPGIHLCDECEFWPPHAYLRRGNQFFLLTQEGEEHFIIENPCNTWSPGPHGLYFERGGEFSVLSVSVEVPPGD